MKRASKLFSVIPTATGDFSLHSRLRERRFTPSYVERPWWVLLAALNGCIMRLSFPLSRYPEQLFLRGIQKGERP